MNENPSYRKCEPWKYFNYAVLNTRGLAHVFDMMRYDRAFFARRLDVDTILSILSDETAHALKPFSILLCRYDFKGRTMANWTHGRLCGDQKYDPVSELTDLFTLGADHTEMRPGSPLKIQSEYTVEGTLAYVLEVMWNNRAMPSTEKDAHLIEHAFHEPDQPMTVTLWTVMSQERQWLLPTGVRN